MSPRLRLAALLGAMVIWFLPLGSYRLFNPDEGRYAEIAREMAASGDWVTPRLDALRYFEKPPLQYWATAAAYQAFGESEWSARLWAALTGFLGLLLTGWIGSRLYGAAAGTLAALVDAARPGRYRPALGAARRAAQSGLRAVLLCARTLHPLPDARASAL